MSWTPKPEEIDWEEGAGILIGQAFHETIVEQCAAKIDANGNTVKIDWRQSGDLLSHVVFDQDGSFTFTEEYAPWVNEVRPFLGIAPQMEPVLEQKLQPLVDRLLILKKKV